MTTLSQFRYSNFDTLSATSSRNDRVLDLSEVVKLNDKISECVGTHYERLFFGLPVTKALALGYQITLRGYFDATESPIATHTAKKMRDLSLIHSQRQNNKTLKLLDLFTGTGQTVWSFLKEGFKVESTEIDPTRALAAINNIKCSGMADKWHFIYYNAISTLDNHIKLHSNFDSVYLDPPWAGRYDYKMNHSFRLEYMVPSGIDLLKKALQISDIVAIKCPQNIQVEQLEKICRELGLLGIVESQEVYGFPRELNQVTVYFIKTGCESSHLKLTYEAITLSEGVI